ncbi:MAG TPA: 2OG-Fe(II) oxygenase [Gammaproteobacteria bacterium]|nr:2OG-Fe(II) oxygenase [Gammaproteobacteria bacterium]
MNRIDALDWNDIAHQLGSQGNVVLPGLLGRAQCRSLAALMDQSAAADRVTLDAMDGGRGELFFLAQPLPEPLAGLRTAFYQRLAPIANRWNEMLDSNERYLAEFKDFQRQCRDAGQSRPLSAISRLREADYQTLHHNADGDCIFPLQLILLLSEPEHDFTGGEFVMTEQRPRMQSRPIVLPLRQGDAAIIPVAHRPCKGSNGHYRVRLKHAISRVRSGERIDVELLFHDGL